MTDNELSSFLKLERAKYSFDELTAEWRAWAVAQIESAERVEMWTMRDERARLYLCRLMWVFAELVDGITDGELLPKFVSGGVVCGLSPSRDISTVFKAALGECERRGLVSREDKNWREPGMPSGSGRVRVYELTLSR